MKKKLGIVLGLLLMLSGCGVKEETYKQVSTEEAVRIMEQETDYVLLDVRTPSEYRERHITGAINVPNEEIGTEAIEELPEKNQLILVYCRSGNRSKQASAKLVKLGYTNVVEFGGINTWNGETESSVW